MSLNNKNLNTKSNKTYKISVLMQYVNNKILANQNICRYLYYNTTTPLLATGTEYDNDKITQIDLTPSKMKGIVFDIPFATSLDIVEQNYLFSHFTSYARGVLNFDINIIVPEKFCKISSGQRQVDIANEISEMFDEMRISFKEGDEAYIEEIGDMKIELYDLVQARLSNTTKSILINMRFKAPLEYPINRLPR